MSEDAGVREVSMREMLEAGLHFGHQARYWNPQMAPYLYGKRNRIHIIDLEKTLMLYRRAMRKLVALEGRDGGEPVVLFVGTKRPARDVVRVEATRCNQPYVSQRWLGGLLTNFRTLKKSIDRLQVYEQTYGEDKAEDPSLTKKESGRRRRVLRKLQRDVGGIHNLKRTPDALFVIDVGHEAIAVREAKRMGIPVFGVVDSNNDPGVVDYAIPGNDDSSCAIQLCLRGAADALLEAHRRREQTAEEDFVEEQEGKQETVAAPAAD